ncbi:cardiolipin synthase [Achromobacter sp. GG226]|nr:cardiolipin synthase [Verticiella sp. GG226]MBU4609014.1 cardiolipin synthase [Verticiella sp. GG226]
MKRVLKVVSVAVSALLLSHCASLPEVSDELPAAAEVRISSERGWLSYRNSRQIIDKLGEGARGEDFLAAHLRVEEAVAGAPLTAGNRVEILDDGPRTYESMYKAIRQARHYIHLETYIFEGDEVGLRLAKLLADKRAEGVAVAVMVDGIGTIGTPTALFDTMREAGIQIVVFNPVNPLAARTAAWSLNKRNHRKILVVDGQVGFTGGINISGVYASSSGGGSGKAARENAAQSGSDEPPWRDTHVRIEGPAVAQLETVFLSGWQLQKGPPLPPGEYFPQVPADGEHVVRIIANDPQAPDGYTVYLTLMSALSSAQRSIHITMAYFVPDPAFIQALKDAAGRGVSVVLVLPEISDSSLVLHAGRSHYGDLLEGGVKIYERNGALLHAKTAVVDGVWSTVGSSNLDWRSFALNYEVNAVILGRAFGERMEALFRDDVAKSTEVTLAQWRERGVGPHDGVARPDGRALALS